MVEAWSPCVSSDPYWSYLMWLTANVHGYIKADLLKAVMMFHLSGLISDARFLTEQPLFVKKKRKNLETTGFPQIKYM